jgi:hypothetical protein
MARGNKNGYGEQNGKNPPANSRRRVLQTSGDAADWESCNCELLAKAIATVSRDGAAIRLGYTRDGGAYAIGFYDGDDKHTEYIRPGEDIDAYLTGVIEDYAK